MQAVASIRLPVAILGYGNQGRAQALNLRDSGVSVFVGARPGAGAEQAKRDGFTVSDFSDAVFHAEVVMFLLPDHVIPGVYSDLGERLNGLFLGFSHGFAVHFCGLKRWEKSHFFLVSPKGAGVWLRKNYETRRYLPGVFAVGPSEHPETVRKVALWYAEAIGVAQKYLKETTFQEEVECDLFGEQTVLCGGIPQLIEAAYDILIARGHQPEMAFFECFYEAKLIIDLLLECGPKGMTQRISPTAYYGGQTVGRKLINAEARAEMERVFEAIRSGEFAARWMAEARKGMPTLKEASEKIAASSLQETYDKLCDKIRE
ncbi:MAG: ketol-acid reductoisomerase [Deltaproteobacteria bacterium]|nr:ketol-acid reductoisomerase [Deltaproteobacteria bacterium]MBI3293662.1 ketol-acid reductoisomerase [Deltaproteobacteria bacterium]